MKRYSKMHIEALSDISKSLGFPVNEETFYIKHEIPEHYFKNLTPADEEYLVGAPMSAVKIVLMDYKVYTVALVPSAESKARKVDFDLCSRLNEVFGFYSTIGCWAYWGCC